MAFLDAFQMPDLKVRTCDRKTINIPEQIAERIPIFRGQRRSHIPIDCAFTSATLQMIMNWIENSIEDMSSANASLQSATIRMLFTLLCATHHLCIKDMYDATCETVAHLAKNWRPSDLRQELRIVNDFDADENAEIERYDELRGRDWTVD